MFLDNMLSVLRIFNCLSLLTLTSNNIIGKQKGQVISRGLGFGLGKKEEGHKMQETLNDDKAHRQDYSSEFVLM